MRSNKNKALSRVLLIVIPLLIGIVLGLWQVQPPFPPREGAEEYPAYQRMMANIKRFTEEPHPSGSAEIERVRAEIITEIEAMGLSAEIQDAVYTVSDVADVWVIMDRVASKDEWWELNREWAIENYNVHSLEELITAAWPMDDGELLLKNILVKIDAPGTDRGVIFVSHYDSVSEAPGAADAMLPVCTILEAMRSLAQNDAPQNDIYFLLTDGEEMGLLGARKFVKDNPEMKDKIDMVINLEMRGNKGGVLLFETSPNAYAMLKAAKRSGARVIGTSWAAEIYAMMPNNTDLTAFLQGGYSGINFAGIEGVEHYHMPTDDYDHLSRATAGHYLQTVLALADYHAYNDLFELREPSAGAVYFPFLPGILALMTAVASHILCVGACALFLIYVVLKIRMKELRASFTLIVMCLLALLSGLSSVFFAAGSYLFYIPLMAMCVTTLLKKQSVLRLTARTLSVISVLLIWVPVLFLLWVSMIQPMML